MIIAHIIIVYLPNTAYLLN